MFDKLKDAFPKEDPFSTLMLTCVLALCIIAAIAAVVVFPIVYLVNIVRFRVLSTPLNMHHPAFVFLNMLDVTSRWTLKNAFLSYRIFLLIPILMMVFCGAFTAFAPDKKNYIALLIIWGVPLLILAFTVGLLAGVAGMVRADSKAIRAVNRLIQSKMTTASSFNILSDPNVDRLTQIKKYQTLVQGFQTEDPTEYAKVLFTINLYLVMYEMGSKHENIDEALKPFQGYARLSRTNFARFLSPQTVYLPNRINEIMLNAPNDNIPAEVKEKAMNEASKWIADVNSKLTSITYTSTGLAFVFVSIGLAIIYLLPLKLVIALNKRIG